MSSLYPPLEPFATHRLGVDGLHRLHVEECGSPRGLPVVFLHGGPGSGCRPDHRRYFDPRHYRILLLDQRGCGRSTPPGETRGNRTEDLVADLEAVRGALGVEAWLLFGGSWGATLALVYAAAHPRAVLGLVLRGVFLGRQRDLDWFCGPGGVCRLLPEAWEAFGGQIPEGERGDLVAAYHRRIHGTDPDAALAAARGWGAWADAVIAGGRSPGPPSGAADDPARLLAKARIEAHYARHRYFLADDQILSQAHRLPRVPVSVVHGRRDLVCAPEAAWALHRALAGSRLLWVPEAGHLASEPAMVDALVGETDRLRRAL
jgi:proline iminopeptidase